MQTVLIVIHLLVVLALIGVVLIQRSEGGGLGIGGGGGGGGFFTARGTANVLTRATAVLAALFFITSLGLTILAGWGRAPTSILGPSSGQSGPSVPTGGSILDQIRPQGAAPGASAPAAPTPPAADAPAPTGPQVPKSQ
ncbi:MULTISPECIES: preprotein translocase subunit SecG [Azorhizobium]|uniref:Protein-export membrane protein SecG n=1 Tax=Azorhizobium caulinodans (strain ATCC 43989 / DSM 5975 / JCM 20966 / LMG 6465 / NBRC 14845 / NCIMB 13405 / ORS 571) TaxID=438753 RepID=A8IBG8_AZOC5|nr:MULTISPECIES: preprotein translocase subunit SecG [Azorhizobium]BAF89066.1 preprotein translocase SecG subunit [Azorhizobium caulinodans ORS 571]